MRDHHHLWATIVLCVVGGSGIAAANLWVMRTGGRSDAALAIADACVTREHQDAATGIPSGELVEACDRYFRFRSDSEAEADEARWRERNGK